MPMQARMANLNDLKRVNSGNLNKKMQVMRALRSQKSVTSFTPYYSLVTFPCTRTGSGPYTYDIAAGSSAAAFGYQKGGDMGAGGNPGVLATYADTNIQTASRTNGGEWFEVMGISVQPHPATQDMQLLALLMQNTSVRLQLNGGKVNLLMGTPLMIPGSSGLYGDAGQWASGPQPIGGGRPRYGFVTNGLPGIENQRPIPEHFLWLPEGQTDSSLNVIFNVDRDCAVTGQLADESAVANSGTAPGGVRGYANPAGSALTIQLMVQLHGLTWSPRSDVI